MIRTDCRATRSAASDVYKRQDGKTFTVIAHNNSRENKYVQSMVLNGKKLDKPFFTHQDIVDGGTLELTMGNVPLK